MQVISFYDSDNQAHWLEEIKRSDWRAGAFLHNLLSKGTFFDAVGQHSKVLLLTEGDELISFCTYAEKDDIQPTELTPWVGFVYTFPAHRGHRYAGLLFDEVERLARREQVREVYLSTNHIGLYEKYGFTYKTQMNDMDGESSRIYVRKTVTAYRKIMPAEMEKLWELQRAYKAEIGENEPGKEDCVRLAAAMDKGQILFFGAWDGAVLAGCCSVTVGFSTFDYAPGGVFEDFYIRPAYRHRGIAPALVRFAYSESGVSSMTVGCADCDVEMYRALGFSVRLGNLLAFE